MLKSQELSDPNSCLNKAGPQERLFVLLARDEAAPATIRFWIEERIRLDKNLRTDPQIVEAEECAQLMRKEWLANLPSLTSMAGALKHMPGDSVEIVRKIRDEWDDSTVRTE